MTDKMRWRYGDTNPVMAAVDSETVIEIGDFIYQGNSLGSGKSAYPASDIEGLNKVGGQDLRSMQEDFADNFLGVAMQRSPAGYTDPIRVAATGVFEFDCPSGTFELGDLVGVDEESSGKKLKDQQVVAVADSASVYAVARVAKRVPEAILSVLVDIRSTVMTGGIKGTTE